jgi:hypothetical protein
VTSPASHHRAGTPRATYSVVRAIMSSHPPDPDRVTSCAVCPECCGEPMADATLPSDREAGAWRFRCVVCDFLMLATAEPDADPLAAEATEHPIGSAAKVEVMRLRALARAQLFHPRDSRRMRDPSPADLAAKGGGAVRTYGAARKRRVSD